MNPNTSVSLQDITLEIVDGIKVVVPDSLNLITPYVLREQLDWFEEEIKFVRTLLQPRDVVLDIGANYGLYALSMAKVVGDHGHVYAFEPASTTASYLQRSIVKNDFGQITLIRAALSNVSGVAEFGLNDQSELNSLNPAMASHGKTESVKLTTLDILAVEFPLQDVSFIKLDAEGEEGNILIGGTNFLKSTSPLIMFELKHLERVNFKLIQQFIDLGFGLYQLIPGLNLLAPFHPNDQLDDYQLNLFACKGDCAARLEQDGKLVSGNSTVSAPVENLTNWDQFILQYPYAQYLESKWRDARQNNPVVGSEKYLEILSLYASTRATMSANMRYIRLRQACHDLRELCIEAPTLPRLISLSRIESELGQRDMALANLDRALSLVMSGENVFKEPFLAASNRFESLDSQNKTTNWLMASLLEQLEKLNFFSSYYSGRETLQRLLAIRNTGFQSLEIDRRIQLIKQRFSISN